LSRARMDDLRASSEFSLSTDSVRLNSTDLSLSPWSAGGGNPELDPWLADSFDLSFEQYFGNGLGYWSIAAFYKDLKSYIVSDQVLMDFSGFPTNGLEPQLDQGYRTVPINGEGGKVEGVEVSASLTGEMISDALEGFGLVASYSYTDSEIEPPTTPSSRLPGLSRDVYNLTFYY